MRFRTAMRAVAAVGIHALSLGGAFAQQPSFTAHVASATTLEDALAAYAHLKTLLPSIKDPFVHQVDLGAQGVSFRVRVGGLMTKPQAEALCATILAVGHPSCSAEDAHALARTQPGYYGDLLLKFLSDGRNMEVAQPFGFVDSQARKWEVPTGTVTDGASIPQAFWSIIGSPFVGKFRLAAVIHDHYCKTKLRSWADTHAAFYESMIASGEDKKKALLMWAAVYRFGPRWAQNQSVCWGTCAGDPAYLENVDIVPTFVESEYSKIVDRVSAGASSMDDLKEFIDANTVWTPDGIAHGAKLRGFVSGQCINCPRKFVEVDAPPEWYGYGDASGGGQVATPSFKVVNVPAADVLNMRAGKDSTFALVAKIPHNAAGIVMLDRCDTAWCRVRYRKTEGWVNTAFLTLDWHAAPEVSGPGKVAGKSASVQAPENTEGIKGHVQNSYPYPLDLQSAPNTKASSLGKLPPGATAGMSDRCDPTWCFVRYGKIEGWVNTYRLNILSGASPQYELEKVGGHEYVRRCTVSENAKSCEHLIYHVGVRIALAEIGVPRTVCDPAKDALPPGRLGTVLGWLKAHPETLDQDSSVAIRAALKGLFPCS